MTINTDVSSASYTANGATTAFTGPFKIFQSSHAKVELNDVLQTSGYTISGVGGDSFTVTFSVAPLAGVVVKIYREVPLTRDIDYPAYGVIPSDTLDKDNDTRVMQIQQLERRLDEAENGLASGIAIVDAGNKFTGTNVEAALQECVTTAELSTIPAADIAIVDAGSQFTGTDVEAALQECAPKTLTGALADLTTTDKTNLVSAINEVKAATSGGASASIVGTAKNLKVSATGANANVAITADEIALEDSSNAYVTARSVSLTINTAASGANGLDTGTVAASTWYYAWVIRKSDGTTAGLASLSSTAPTMPSGYTFKARVGAFRTDGTGNKYPLGYVQYGRIAQYVLSANVAKIPQIGSKTWGTYPSTYEAASLSNFVPPTAWRIDISIASSINQTSGLAPNNSFGAVNDGVTNPPPMQNIAYPQGRSWMTLESTNIYVCSSNTLTVMCNGWEDI